MQLPSPLGKDPALPSPVGPLSGLIGLGGGGGGTGFMLAADVSLASAVFTSIFGAFATPAAGDHWIMQGGLYVSSGVGAAGGVTLQIVSAGATGRLGIMGPTALATFGNNATAINAGSGAFVNFDASGQDQVLVIDSGILTAGAPIDFQWKDTTVGNSYTLRAGSWVLFTKSS
jgi:hypothetical protein